MKVPAATDRRVQRTQRLLRDALVTLVIEKGWDEISIQDVCDRADVGRSTFYSHFADREELLLSGFDDLKKHLRAAGALGDERRVLRFVRPLLQHMDENRRLFRALVGKRTADVVVRHMRDLIRDLTREELSRSLDGQALTLSASFVTGGVFELLRWWLESRPAVDVEVADDAVQRMVKKVLRP